jgi:hypothetical protein
MRYRMVDGTEYSGRGYADVVAAMAHDKLTEPKSLETYRRATANRVSEQYGVIVDASDNKPFIKSLEAAKLMKRVA